MSQPEIFEELIAFAPPGVDMLRFECATCGNECLVKHIPVRCHPGCSKADWRLMANQQTYKVNGTDWTHPLGVRLPPQGEAANHPKCATDCSTAEMPTCGVLRSKPVQIQATSLPGDCNSGPHVQLFALCEDGSIWVQYHSSGHSNVPTDGLWHMIQPPAGVVDTNNKPRKILGNVSKTDRNFQVINFDDANGNQCELHQSSVIFFKYDDALKNHGSSALWLGRAGENRMHLSREHVAELIAIFQGWLNSGELND